ncbi:MAG: ADP-ribose pyrophosphatase, partial [Dehalococcoidia bacterium]
MSDHVEDETPSLLTSEPLGAAGYLTFRRDTIRFPNGHEAERAIVGHPGAVAIIAVDADGKWLLVSQYRHA